MISTPDGVIEVEGRSQALGGRQDQLRLIALRRAAAIVMVGAGTARAENYGPPSKKGQRIAVVTKSCKLDFSSLLFTSGAGLVATTLNGPTVPVDSVRGGETEVDLKAIIAQLPHGIIHVEGGPALNGALFDAGCVDAINLTIAPHIGGFRGPSFSRAPHMTQNFTLVSLENAGDFVFVRYEKITTA